MLFATCRPRNHPSPNSSSRSSNSTRSPFLRLSSSELRAIKSSASTRRGLVVGISAHCLAGGVRRRTDHHQDVAHVGPGRPIVCSRRHCRRHLFRPEWTRWRRRVDALAESCLCRCPARHPFEAAWTSSSFRGRRRRGLGSAGGSPCAPPYSATKSKRAVPTGLKLG